MSAHKDEEFLRAGNRPQETTKAENAKVDKATTEKCQLKSVRYRGALMGFVKLVGGVAAYVGALALVVMSLANLVGAGTFGLTTGMVLSVYFTAVIHAVFGLIFVN